MIRNLTTGTIVAYEVENCDTFWKRGRGLMFRKALTEEEALLFVYGKESVSATSIHIPSSSGGRTTSSSGSIPRASSAGSAYI